MTWSRFDDAARKHPKALMAGNDAWGFWCAAIMYSNQYGTDGFIPDVALATQVLPVPIAKSKAKKLAEACCAAVTAPGGPGLFVRDEERGGYVIHDFLDWNPSKAETDEKRKKDRERKKPGGSDSGVPPSGNPPGRRTDSEKLPRGNSTDGQVDSVARAQAPAGAPTRVPARPARPAIPDPPAEETSHVRDAGDFTQETSCPFDLVRRATACGLNASLAQRLGEDERDVLACGSEFVEFWTVQRGGQRKTNWLGRYGRWIESKSRAGELRGLGAKRNRDEPTEERPVELHPRAAARLAAQAAEAQRVQAELAAEAASKPVRRDIDKLMAGIGGSE
jgi:hypothetical protein